MDFWDSAIVLTLIFINAMSTNPITDGVRDTMDGCLSREGSNAEFHVNCNSV